MPFYCGVDLRARDWHVCVIGDGLAPLVREKVRPDPSRLLTLSEPSKEPLQIVVGSTFKW